VPYFRNDNGELLEEPFQVSFIATAPVQAIQARERGLQHVVREVMKRRLRKVVQVAIQFGHRVLLLGAFGCEAFGNDPYEIAEIEKEILIDEGLGQFFDIIVNPVPDGFRYQNYDAFAQVLAPYSDGSQ
jgi:uncharacterized protein (TIGR02452 family)